MMVFRVLLSLITAAVPSVLLVTLHVVAARNNMLDVATLLLSQLLLRQVHVLRAIHFSQRRSWLLVTPGDTSFRCCTLSFLSSCSLHPRINRRHQRPMHRWIVRTGFHRGMHELAEVARRKVRQMARRKMRRGCEKPVREVATSPQHTAHVGYVAGFWQ